jgi:hypothetical protein
MSMTLVETITAGSGGVASMTFSSIPQTGTDLLLVVSHRAASGGPILKIRPNGSSTGFTARQLYGDGSSRASYTVTDENIVSMQPGDATANTFGNTSFYIPNYSGNTNKSISVDSVTENNGTTAYQEIIAILWSNTAAITSIVLTSTVNLAQHSTASLYIVTKGSGGATTSP